MNSGNPLAQLLNYLRYKGKQAGVSIKKISEEYTSQTCPKCGHRHKPSGRIYQYKNPDCDFVGIRDLVGAANIKNEDENETIKANHVLPPDKAKYRRPVKLRPPLTRLDCVVPMTTGKWLDNTTQTAQALSSAEGNTSSTLSDVA
jgi:putative transposase